MVPPVVRVTAIESFTPPPSPRLTMALLLPAKLLRLV
jgi:hypothetical protein